MIANEKPRLTAPIGLRRCPVHGQLVATDGDGNLLGRCAGCANDASLAMQIIARRRS